MLIILALNLYTEIAILVHVRRLGNVLYPDYVISKFLKRSYMYIVMNATTGLLNLLVTESVVDITLSRSR